MEQQNISEKLTKFAVFAGFTREQLEIIAKHLTYQKIAEKTDFIFQDELGGTMYFILSGAVKIYRLTENGEEINIALKGEGDIVGEQALIDNSERSATVQALQQTEVLVLHRKDFQTLLTQFPQIAINMLKDFSQKLRDANENIESLSSSSLTERTWKTLLALRKIFGSNDIHLSQEELSVLIGATRARITESLNLLQHEQKILLSHKNIHIL